MLEKEAEENWAKPQNLTADDTDSTDLHGSKSQIRTRGNRVIARDLVIGKAKLPLIGADERGSEGKNLATDNTDSTEFTRIKKEFKRAILNL